MKRMTIYFATGVMAFTALVLALRDAREISRNEPETREQSMDRRRADADAALLRACTNAVPGITHVVFAYCETHDENFGAWRGQATVDHVNRFGGIERTNLRFVYYSVMGSGHWIAE